MSLMVNNFQVSRVHENGINYGAIGEKRAILKRPPDFINHAEASECLQNNKNINRNFSKLAVGGNFHQQNINRFLQRYRVPHAIPDGVKQDKPHSSFPPYPSSSRKQPPVYHLFEQPSSLDRTISQSSEEFSRDTTPNFYPRMPPMDFSPTTTTSSSYSDLLDTEESWSDEDENSPPYSPTHPNKYPVEIEYHSSKHCSYQRQPTKSGFKIKQLRQNTYDDLISSKVKDFQQIKYYEKDLVRVCRCGKYQQMDGPLVHGMATDSNGYEIHYSQKCKWKAYDDFKTGERVLIRLCKCYKPTL